ncbi:DedA family protein [Propioniciclava soli]|uniref:VTT domain-containing protein n=1 Tax=Propioniciclava soli TaxID=2775081 RepID=A0ABZ3CEM2_9ACTN
MDPRTWDAPWAVIFGALWVIVMLRANATYWLGRLAARGAESTRARRVMASPGYRTAADRLNRWGAPVVTLSFLTVGVQTVVNVAAGATRMPLRRYLPAVALGCVAWAAIYGTVGFFSVEALVVVWERAPVLAVALGVSLVGAFAAFVVWRVKDARAGRVRPPVPADDVPAGSRGTDRH